MKRFVSRIVLAFAIAGLAAGSAHADTATPALSVKTLDGGTFDLSAERGHWVIVNFWATWCSPCIKEMPDISHFVASRKDVRVIGIAFGDEEDADVVEFLKKHPVEYPVANLPIESPPADFGAPRGLPTTYLIAPDGHVAKKFTGPVTPGELESAMAGRAKQP